MQMIIVNKKRKKAADDVRDGAARVSQEIGRAHV